MMERPRNKESKLYMVFAGSETALRFKITFHQYYYTIILEIKKLRD